jgi:hypothetical protein
MDHDIRCPFCTRLGVARKETVVTPTARVTHFVCGSCLGKWDRSVEVREFTPPKDGTLA